jgi:primosomal protein N' (replication factor Y)
MPSEPRPTPAASVTDRTPAIATVAIDNAPLAAASPRDYRLPADLAPLAAIGTRVTVAIGRKQRTGYLLDVRPGTTEDADLAPLTGLIAPEPVLTPETIALVKAVAARYAGTLPEILRLAVPERRARVETEPAQPPQPVTPPDTTAWAAYTHGEAFLRALTARKAPRAVWNARHGEQWPHRFAEAAAATAAAGRSAVLIVPSQTDLALLDAALHDLLGPGRHVTLTSDMGATPRYRSYLHAARGTVRIVAGTRSAAYTPVHDLGLVAIWDDGNTAHAEQRKPHPHARDVLLTRANLTGAAILSGGHARTAHAQLLVNTGWAASITPAPRHQQRPRVLTAGTDAHLERDGHNARIPTFAWKAAKTALEQGRSVLVQVPRTGYLPALACSRCHTPATCPHCSKPLAITSPHAPPTCTGCGHTSTGTRCSDCGSAHVKATVVGTERTAAELARTFRSATVTESTSGNRLHTAPPGPSIVVATPGCEPPSEDPYGAVLLLDAWSLIARPEWDAHEQAVRRWMNAAALAAPDATVAVTADAADPAVQTLIRWDAAWFASRDLHERETLGFPPHQRFASLTGPSGAPDEFAAELPTDLAAELIGPFPLPDGTEQVLVRVARRSTPALTAALASIREQRARARAVPVAVRVDPVAIA